MPGGIHPPIELMLKWPLPNETNPETRSNAIILVACISGPITILLLFVRLWVRVFHQRSPGWDDWVMLVAMIPTIALTVLFPLASEYGFSRHVWDYNPLKYPRRMVNARKYILAIECIFCVASGLIKISILLFYRRLSSRAVSSTFKWVTWLTIGFIAAYTVALTIAPIVGCKPIEAFWEQVDIQKQLEGYKYDCFNEGADVFAASIISLAQDVLTAMLPTFLYWNLQIPIRQKIALFGIFAIGYGVVAIGALRAYYSWHIFFETYDVTWATWDLMLVTMLELHIGCFCANAPALKVFFKHFLYEGMSSFSRSRSRSNSARQKSSGNYGSKSNISYGVAGKVASLLSSRSKSGYISEPGTHVSVDTHGGVLVKKDITVSRPEPIEHKNDSHESIHTTDAIYSHYCTDIEHVQRPEGRRTSRGSSVRSTDRPVYVELSALPRIPRSASKAKSPRSPMPATFVSHSETNAVPRRNEPTWPRADNQLHNSNTTELPTHSLSREKPNWQTWA